MKTKIVLSLFGVILVAGFLVWFNRASILTMVVLHRAQAAKVEVAPYQPIVWSRGPDATEIPSSERPPNIILILFDDLGFNDLSTFGGGVADGRVPTPNIDRLAAEGATFLNAYSGTGTCAPSRAMLMTGRYPTRTGFEFTPTPDGMGRVVATVANGMDRGALPAIKLNKNSDEVSFDDQGLPGSEVTIAEMLRDHDYHSVHIGKWHLGRRTDFLPNAQGFNESLLMHSGLYLPEADPDVVNAKLDFDPIDRFQWARYQYAASFNGGAPFEPGGYLTDWWTNESLNVIDANRNRPFFLYLAHWGVHSPLQATREDYEAVGDIQPHRLRVYAAMIRALDRSVGRIVEKLEAEGLSDNTLIILSSDNGGAGYIGLPDINAPYRGWKITLFEGGIRVPMMMKWPGQIAPGTVIDTPVAHIDLMPTIAAATGADLPEGVAIDGKSMFGEATGTGRIERLDEAIFWQSGFYKVVRAGDWKLQVNERQDMLWLFDLAADPTEQVNLAADRPDKVAELKALIEAHHDGAVAPLYAHQLESPIAIDHTVDQAIEPGAEYVIWPN